MNLRVKILLLGMMIWIIKFIVGGIIFAIWGEDAAEMLLLISGIESFFVSLGLALALVLMFKNKIENPKQTLWEAGIAWYGILLIMDLIVLYGVLGLEIEFWFPTIFSYFNVLIIPAVVGHLLN